jgi:hypothetical protein
MSKYCGNAFAIACVVMISVFLTYETITPGRCSYTKDDKHPGFCELRFYNSEKDISKRDDCDFFLLDSLNNSNSTSVDGTTTCWLTKWHKNEITGRIHFEFPEAAVPYTSSWYISWRNWAVFFALASFVSAVCVVESDIVEEENTKDLHILGIVQYLSVVWLLIASSRMDERMCTDEIHDRRCIKSRSNGCLCWVITIHSLKHILAYFLPKLCRRWMMVCVAMTIPTVLILDSAAHVPYYWMLWVVLIANAIGIVCVFSFYIGKLICYFIVDGNSNNRRYRRLADDDNDDVNEIDLDETC